MTPDIVLPYVRTRIAGGCLQALLYALRMHCCTPNRLLYALHTALLGPKTFYIMHCAGNLQAHEATSYLALLMLIATALYGLCCNALAQMP